MKTNSPDGSGAFLGALLIIVLLTVIANQHESINVRTMRVYCSNSIHFSDQDCIDLKKQDELDRIEKGLK